MKLKNAYLYRMHDAKKAVGIFYMVLLVLLTVGCVMLGLTNETGSTVGGFEMTGMTFIFILGLNSFKEYFYVYLQHGVSRKTGFISFVASIGTIAPFMALVDIIICRIFGYFQNFIPAFEQIYGVFGGSRTGAGYLITQYFWTVTAYLAYGMAGYFVTILYYRMNKASKIAVSVGVPAFFLVILPTIDYNFFKGKIAAWMAKVGAFLFGTGETPHPINSMITCVAIAALLGGLAYLLSRRAAVKRK